MKTLNKVQLIGRLGKDPEVQKFDGDNMVVRFPLATNESYKDKNGQLVESTDWHNIVAWRKLGQIAEQYIKKGMSIYVEGKIRSRSYDDKDGVKRYVTEIVADNFIMLDKKEENDRIKSSQGVSSSAAPKNLVEEDGSDLPF
jgi:single-strand DNA-binding protein